MIKVLGQETPSCKTPGPRGRPRRAGDPPSPGPGAAAARAAAASDALGRYGTEACCFFTSREGPPSDSGGCSATRREGRLSDPTAGAAGAIHRGTRARLSAAHRAQGYNGHWGSYWRCEQRGR